MIVYILFVALILAMLVLALRLGHDAARKRNAQQDDPDSDPDAAPTP
jgi:hypothetical protein